MSELFKRAVPGVLAAAAAVTAIAGFDAVIHKGAGASAGGGDTSGGIGGSGAAGPQSTGSTPGQDACSSARTVRGASAGTPWGPVQVVATVGADSQLCSVKAVAYPSNDPKSQMINSRAIPMLNSSATQAGIEFDAVSGATYTSEGYRKSLQSVLDQL